MFRRLGVLCGVCAGLTAGAGTLQADLTQGFEGGGTTYSFSSSDAGDSVPAVMTDGANSFARIVDSAGDNNSIAFDEVIDITGPAPLGKTLAFDLRIGGDLSDANFAGGAGVGFAATGPWGATGPANPGLDDAANDWESPTFTGTVMLGFRPKENTISLNGFGATIAEIGTGVALPFDLNDGVFRRAILTVVPNPSDSTKALFSLDVTEDLSGSTITYPGLMSDVAADINLNGLPPNRVLAGARAVNGDLLVDMDNFSVQFIPEPSSFALAGLGLGGLVALQRRRRR